MYVRILDKSHCHIDTSRTTLLTHEAAPKGARATLLVPPEPTSPTIRGTVASREPIRPWHASVTKTDHGWLRGYGLNTA